MHPFTDAIVSRGGGLGEFSVRGGFFAFNHAGRACRWFLEIFHQACWRYSVKREIKLNASIYILKKKSNIIFI